MYFALMRLQQINVVFLKSIFKKLPILKFLCQAYVFHYFLFQCIRKKGEVSNKYYCIFIQGLSFFDPFSVSLKSLIFIFHTNYSILYYIAYEL